MSGKRISAQGQHYGFEWNNKNLHENGGKHCQKKVDISSILFLLDIKAKVIYLYSMIWTFKESHVSKSTCKWKHYSQG